MCRMIGVISRHPVRMAPYLEALRRQASEGVEAPHADGYGLALFAGGHWLHVREQCPIYESDLGVLGELTGSILILHARKASPGTAINLTKLHPFCWPGHNPGVMFCQNGTIRRPENLRTASDASAIDTEKYYEIVIRHYEALRDFGEAIQGAVEEIGNSGGDPTSLNALLSDGQQLIAWKGRVLPENRNYHTLFVREEADRSIVSTEPFPLEGTGEWTRLEGLWRKSFCPESTTSQK